MKYENKYDQVEYPNKHLFLKTSGLLGLLFLFAFIFYKQGLVDAIKKVQPKASNEVVRYVKDTITVNSIITLYHSTLKECGSTKNIGAFGDTMKLGDAAASQWMFDHCINYKDSVKILTGSLKGTYCIKDKAGSKSGLIDVYQTLDSKKHDCYKSNIIIIRHQNT